MKTISLDFNGFWREVNKRGVPSKSGVYCVYTCVHNKEEKTVTINKLLYIGESSNVHDRISNHDRLDDWKKHLKANETLCYSFAAINSNDRERAEAALIYKHQPLTNEEHMDHFIYEDTKMLLSGKTAKLSTNFTVRKTN